MLPEDRIHYWTVLEVRPGTKHQPRTVFCRCVCGKQKTVTAKDLRNGKTRSCGSVTRSWFFKRLEECQGDPDACWNWNGPQGRGGYGLAMVHGHFDRTHNHAWRVLVGPIPDGLELDHLCKNPLCMNPAHLEPVTPRVNCLRSDNVAAVNARKTHCLRGHPFDEANTYLQPDGGRSCRTCRREQMRQQRLKSPPQLLPPDRP